jgi:hypothetical protein
MKRYVVTSPVYQYKEIVCEYGGPTYDVQDSFLVDAPNSTKAKWAALQMGKATPGSSWAEPGYCHDGHPLRGVTAVLAPDEDPKDWTNLYAIVE